MYDGEFLARVIREYSKNSEKDLLEAKEGGNPYLINYYEGRASAFGFLSGLLDMIDKEKADKEVVE